MFACWKSFSIRKGLGPLAPTCQYSNNGLSLQSCASFRLPPAREAAMTNGLGSPLARSLILHFGAIKRRAIRKEVWKYDSAL